MPTAPTFNTFGDKTSPVAASTLDTNFTSIYDSLRNWNNYSPVGDDVGTANAYVVNVAVCITVTLAEPLMLTFPVT